MAKNAKIRLEQIIRAQKLLQDLPEKDERKTRQEAATLLETDFRKAFQKGYSPKEITAMLKNAGIIIPAYLVKNFLTPENEKSRHKFVPKKETEKPFSKAQFTVTPDTSDEEL